MIGSLKLRFCFIEKRGGEGGKRGEERREGGVKGRKEREREGGVRGKE